MHTRRTTRNTIAALLALGCVYAPSLARAQTDVTPPLPNVLILLDTSGSMERRPDGTLPPVGIGATSTTERNRWVQALEVLGGSISGYQMLGVKRDGSTTSDFYNEYNLNGAAPYDADYYLPHFRPISKVSTKSCTIGSSSLSGAKSWPTDWTTWGVSNFGFRSWNGATLGPIGSCLPSDFDTDHLGVLDTFRDQARFGLMTFDSLPDPKTGWTGTAQNAAEGMTGQWSYYSGWNKSSGLGPSYGWPSGCAVDATTKNSHLFEVGARNPSAPPWEGPLVGFASDDSTTALRNVNDRIRWAMLAARPYGATPLGPMLADAQYYLQDDPDGPKSDPYNTCRGNFIILITDGFPNSDMRPSCEDPSSDKSPPTQVSGDPVSGCTSFGKGCCPSKRPQDITADLLKPPAGKTPVKTFVVGFAVSDDTGKDVKCETIDPASGICGTMAKTDPQYPCCTLHEMALNGGTSKALFASDTGSLRAALIAAMNAATASTSTSRTLPAFTQGTATAASNGQYEFRSSFKVSAFSSWYGILERVRWVCENVSGTLTPKEQLVDKTQGDDFAWDLNKQTTRRFISMDPTSAKAAADSTLRPNLNSGDADVMGPTTGTVVDANGSTFVATMTSSAMNIAASGCGPDATTADECKQKLLNYALALPQPKSTWLSRVGNAMADIYHATPVGVGAPSSFLRDESYTTFRDLNAKRTPMLLAATNDGILHGFRTDVTSEADPVELWGFIPPAVLPSIGKQYGGAHALLLDAAPVVKDVAFGLATSTTPWGRTTKNATSGQANWRTVAVGALTVGRGYYALDVTDPKAPKLLWQITKVKDASGNDFDMFGATPGVPAIGTVFYSDGVNPAVETPVAFLPGGDATINKTGTCQRWQKSPVTSDPYTRWRDNVRCWVGAGNSFTVVRLWDGKIIRSFRNDPAGLTPDHPAEPGNAAVAFKSAGKINIVTGTTGYANIDSPINGAVALYPALPGTVTVRAFVGDGDGTLWKLDVSSPNPDDWTFKIFHDAYFPSDPANTKPAVWGPAQTAPVLSVDAFGDIVVNYATGDQATFSVNNLNHMYSVTEQSSGLGTARTTTTKLNWHIKFTGGVTPTGPLSLFSGRLFFSTFTPDVASGDVCLTGQGTIWGVDYLETEPKVLNDDGTPVPRGRHEQTSPGDAILASGTCPPAIPNKDGRGIGFDKYFRCIQLAGGSIVFGAGVTQRPTCVDTATSSIGTDPYFGTSSSHSTLAAITPGDFQLVAQTGPKSGTAAGGTGGTGGSTTNTFTRTLTAPLSVTRIDSWAAIIE
jgi:type IV pilus assembly protein PilY1